MAKPIVRYRMAVFAGLGPVSRRPFVHVHMAHDPDPQIVNGVRQIDFDDDGKITRIETRDTVYVQVK